MALPNWANGVAGWAKGHKAQAAGIGMGVVCADGVSVFRRGRSGDGRSKDRKKGTCSAPARCPKT